MSEVYGDCGMAFEGASVLSIFRISSLADVKAFYAWFVLRVFILFLKVWPLGTQWGMLGSVEGWIVRLWRSLLLGKLQ